MSTALQLQTKHAWNGMLRWSNLLAEPFAANIHGLVPSCAPTRSFVAGDEDAQVAEPAKQALACLGQHVQPQTWMPLALEPLLLPGTPQAALSAALTSLAALLNGEPTRAAWIHTIFPSCVSVCSIIWLVCVAPPAASKRCDGLKPAGHHT